MTDSSENPANALTRDAVQEKLTSALQSALSEGDLPAVDSSDLPPVTVERPQKPEHGDYASNIALRLAKPMRMKPMDIAEVIAARVEPEGPVASASAGPPGFVNITLDHAWLASQVDAIREAGEKFGRVDTGKGKTVQVEFVSVNPTGPLHIGHARGAVIGSGLATVLDAAGYDVHREYYVNDAGRQVDLFAGSLYARYMQHFGGDEQVPEDGYQGDYVTELAGEIALEVGDRFKDLPRDDAVAELRAIGLQRMLAIIRGDLDTLGVEMDVWFNESSLFDDGTYRRVKKMLSDKGLIVKRDGAVWFVSTALGEDKDNVIERTGGDPTYFASDIAYHWDKFVRRGFDRVIDVWGADHQGHVPRMKAVVAALDVDPDRLIFLLTQMVKIKRGDETVKVSKRAGELLTLKELVDEVGPDACRFFFLSRSPDSQMDFDMELAKEQSSDNPVYYVQYAHARIAGILRLATERGIDYSDGDSALLKHDAELALIRKILELPELVDHMAERLEPHHLPHYAGELATAFHWFYQQCRVVSSEPGDAGITAARLKLVDAARVGLGRCLALMGMAAPERM